MAVDFEAMHAAISKTKTDAHAAGDTSHFASNDDANMGRTGAVGSGAGGISNQSNYNGESAWTGQPAGGPKLVDPRSAPSAAPTFGKRNRG
jgi:hypothetical protein